MTAAVEIDVSDLCFAARALAQSHPMTEASHRSRQECLDTERRRQPVSELADWAATALLVGYCLRRSEEERVDTTKLAGSASANAEIDLKSVTAVSEIDPKEATAVSEIDPKSVTAVSESLRVGDPGGVSLLPADVIIAALDRIIGTELDKRREHLREQLDDAAWSELEDYIAWWVIHGYALRASERPGP